MAREKSSLSPHDQRFARRVAALRGYRKMTQEQLADAVGIGRTAIADIERLARRSPVGEAHLIAQALDVPLGDLLAEKELILHTETRID